MGETQVPVLIAGGGTVGLAMAVFLGHHGVRALVVERRAAPSDHPRATGLSGRTLELMREVGLQQAVEKECYVPADRIWRRTVRTLAELRTAPAECTVPETHPMLAVGGPSDLLTPAPVPGSCPQDHLDAVLLPAAAERGATVTFGTELTGLRQDADGVTATVRGPAGERRVRADYLVAADGAGSTVRALLGIGCDGPGRVGRRTLNILFRADLTAVVPRVPVLTDITHPDATGRLAALDGRRRWALHVIADDGERYDEERCRALIRTAVGVPDLEVEVLSALPWRPTARVARRFQDGRVFLVGDAAHTVPPQGAFGLNSGIADAHNLAWKLAAVLRDQAGAALLDSYDAERRPVAVFTMEQALLRHRDPRLHWSPGAVAERAAAGAAGAPVVHLGYRYASSAVVGGSRDLPSLEDITGLLDGTPGSRLPHRWLRRDGAETSTLDLIGSRFTLFAGPDAPGWTEAAPAAAARLGVPLNVYRIGSADLADPSGTWHEDVGIGARGALLARPDGFVAWRTGTCPADAAAAVEAALAQVTGRTALLPRHPAAASR